MGVSRLRLLAAFVTKKEEPKDDSNTSQQCGLYVHLS